MVEPLPPLFVHPRFEFSKREKVWWGIEFYQAIGSNQISNIKLGEFVAHFSTIHHLQPPREDETSSFFKSHFQEHNFQEHISVVAKSDWVGIILAIDSDGTTDFWKWCWNAIFALLMLQRRSALDEERLKRIYENTSETSMLICYPNRLTTKESFSERILFMKKTGLSSHCLLRKSSGYFIL